jgi:hypothetical protein
MELKAQLDRVEKLMHAGRAQLGQSDKSDTAMLTILRAKLAQAESCPYKEGLDFGGSDDLQRRLTPGVHRDGAWFISDAGSKPIWRYVSESGHSWLLPEYASGCHEATSFKLRAGVAIEKLRNEIAWIEAGRPEFASRNNPGGWSWDSHRDQYEVEDESVMDQIPF